MTGPHLRRHLRHRIALLGLAIRRAESRWHLETDPDRRFGLALQAHALHLRRADLQARLNH